MRVLAVCMCVFSHQHRLHSLYIGHFMSDFSVFTAHYLLPTLSLNRFRPPKRHLNWLNEQAGQREKERERACEREEESERTRVRVKYKDRESDRCAYKRIVQCVQHSVSQSYWRVADQHLSIYLFTRCSAQDHTNPRIAKNERNSELWASSEI